MPSPISPASPRQRTPAALSKQSSVRHVVYTFVVIALICHVIRPASALRCYTCSYVESEKDDTCVKDANATERITDCTKKYCTIMRQERVSPAGKVISFIRDCLDKPLFLNKVIEDSTFKTYYRSCTTDLCNDSSGKQSGSSTDPNHGAAQNMIVKGKDGASQSVRVGVSLVCLSAAVHFIRAACL